MRPTSSLAGQVEYTFKHALIRDVAYAGLSIARRARAHAAVGEWLAELSPDRPEELSELVAFHYKAALEEGADLAWPVGSAEIAAVRRRARAAFLVGGSTARKRYALEQAIELHGLALELATTDEERAMALEELGDDHDAAYDGDRALPAWRRRSPCAGRRRVRVARRADVDEGGPRGRHSVGWLQRGSRADVIDRYVDAGLEVAPKGRRGPGCSPSGRRSGCAGWPSIGPTRCRWKSGSRPARKGSRMRGRSATARSSRTPCGPSGRSS